LFQSTAAGMISIAEDRENDFSRTLFVAPVSRLTLVAGKIGGEATVALPATLALAGDVAGRRILDAGCGSGPLFAALRDRSAIVTGFDRSTRMLELARRRLGDGADPRVADLGPEARRPTDHLR
jgi:predicted TPR repeat methyltransferase